ncbi:MAG: ribbon-helix-helix domain-containing protein [Candidatus Helarchaeota archaeon]
MSDYLKERITIRLTKRYLGLLEELVENGIYNSKNEAIRDALRRLFEHYKILSVKNADGIKKD